MIKFCNFKGNIVACDDNTIQKYSLQPIYTCTDDEYENAGCVYHIVNGQVVLGKDEKELAQQEIQELNQKLLDTDYIANKLAEAVSKYIATGDNTEVVELRTKYSKELENRQLWRDRINELEVKNGL